MSSNTIIPSAGINCTQQVQFNYLLISKTRFVYGQKVNYLKTEILEFQFHANLLCLSSLKGWVRVSACSASRYLVPSPQMRYVQNKSKVTGHLFKEVCELINI